MANLLETLKNVLEQDERFVNEDGELLRNNVIEKANKLDADLLKLLFGNADLKAKFFIKVGDYTVFDQKTFMYVVSNREFLPDSYTRFKQNVGLATKDGEFLKNKNDIELVFPYKDCVLEGGQTKEDQKRGEIFYNELLADDEVDKLLAPKVLVNAKRYTKDGEENNITLNENDNLIIKGNNLLVISSLLKKYEGKVKCIYIDPPFNTGNDSFNYNDKFTRSTWLTFMKNRLEIAKKLLSNDGNIFIHIDINQSHYLKTLMDGIFKPDNFVEEIIWAYGSPSGGRAASPKPVNIHDYILHYAKEYSVRKQKHVYIPYSEKYINDWFKYKDDDGRVYQRRQRGKDEKGNVIWEKQYLDESKGIPLSTVWTDIKQIYADPRAYKEGNTVDVEVIKKFSGGQKPEALIKRFFEMVTDEGDLVLDFNLGTGTTMAVAQKMRRKYIGVEQLDFQIDICLKRMIKVLSGDKAGISKEINWQGGGSFVYCELAKLNQNYVEKIEVATTKAQLTKLKNEIIKTGFISCKVKISDIDNNAEEWEALSVEDKKKFLMELLDKNMLYVNYSDMDDADFTVKEEDKKFTRSFYGEE